MVRSEDFSWCHGPWIVTGDFNSIMAPDERVGAYVRLQELVSLRECMQTCGLQDMNGS